MKRFFATILKVFEPEGSLEATRREVAEAGRDAPKLYGRNWSDRAHL